MAASTSQQLDGRSALVTGGGRGIGRGISMILASRGAEVCVSDIDPANAEQVAAEINEGGGTRLCNWRRRYRHRLDI